MELNKFVGNKIRQFRENSQMSQGALATELETTRQTISRYENGERKVSQDVLYQLAGIFNQPIDAFFPPRASANDKNEHVLTIAAHLDADVTEEEMRDILAYIDMKKRLHRGE
ncbi:helix-turn-helix transcriptional regulator [Listeria valentina]|uniref:helix-turn-helix transcriptional regulator n=1 Tax=Listeria valentina TaxID=2705293 RepID=UPI0014314DFB|nr:helix-turn-helix transcriptional regulator [Listeria valentina]